MSKAQQHIAIVGGGWAGLAAAVELTSKGHRISLFESARQLGGRARRLEWSNMALDNGQHLMIGAYQQMLQLLDTLGVDARQFFRRLPHHMLMKDAQTGERLFELRLPTFPAPFHLLFGVMQIPQLSLKEKLQLLFRFNRLLNSPLYEDMSVTDWLASARLPGNYVDRLLKPVCLAALTTHPHQASARAFQSVLQQTFNASADFTDLLIPTTDLGTLFPEQAAQFIRDRGGDIFTGHKLENLQVEHQQVSQLRINQQSFEFQQVILATPPSVTARLLSSHPETHHISRQLEQLSYEPVATLYLKFDKPVRLEVPMMGLLNGIGEWLFDRHVSGHPDVLAVVISASGPHLELPRDELSRRVYGEAKQVIPQLGQLVDSQLIIEKRATIRCHPGVDKLRPAIDTPLSNLKLCGDYVYIEENNHSGLPSTLEGALRSGVKCAQQLIQTIN